MTEHTITSGERGVRQRPERPPAQLVVWHGDRPRTRPSRHVLAGVELVVIGRGDGGAVRGAEEWGASLALRLPDGLVSQRHVTLKRLEERWSLEDAGSKNGTFVNGVRARRAILFDGDVVEVGHTVMVFRDSRPVACPERLDARIDELPAPAGLATFVQPLTEAYAALARVAVTSGSVVVLGESGTGKELVARAVHEISARKGPFVAVNCGALPANLVEATLFGHRKGAFSGAVDDRPGVVRAAAGGTLFLDEIGDLPEAFQAAFLRVLQEREVVPVGDTRPVKVDLRVVTATHRALPELIAEGKFRADLYARLSGLVVRLPRLADRREDLGFIIATLLERIEGGAAVRFTPAAARALFHHDWPLNVRELEKTLTTAVALADEGLIDIGHLGEELAREEEDVDADDRLLTELKALLLEHRGNLAAISRAMGKGRTQIQRWLKRYDLDPESFRRDPGDQSA